MTDTFTYDNTLSTDLAKVRFHIGDTNANGAYLYDETINALLTLEGSVGGAVIACIKYIITQLSVPDFNEKDRISVSMGNALEYWNKMLKDKAQEFGISLSGVTASSTISHPYRADSYQYTTSTRIPTDSDVTDVYDGRP